jgi:hypothetical protein
MDPVIEWLALDPDNASRFQGVVSLLLVLGVIFIAEMCFCKTNNPEDE